MSNLTASWNGPIVAADDDAALVARIHDDPSAFAALYEMYLDRIYAYLRARTVGEDDAADLAQQVFVQAFSALPRYRARKVPFIAWLLRIARNVAVDFHRRKRVTVTWDLLPESLHPQSTETLEGVVIRREALDQLRLLVRSCDEETRELLLLRFGLRLTIKEIAIVMDKKEETVKKRLSRTLLALKEHYDDGTR